MFASGSPFKKLAVTFLMTAGWFLAFANNNNILSQQSEYALFPIWDERGKEGFINASGKTIIEPQFDAVTQFSEGMAAVRVGNKWGYIDRTGTVVITPRWREVYPFSDGVAAVVDGIHGHAYTPLPEEGDPFEITIRACGIIDKSGRYAIEPSLDRKFTACPIFSQGLAGVCFDPILKIFFPEFTDAGQCGYLNKSGKWAITPQFDGATNFLEDLALVRLRQYQDAATNTSLSDFAFIEKSGKVILSLKGYLAANQFREGLARVSNRAGKTTFIDRTGRVRFELDAIDVRDFGDGRALVQDPRTKLFGYVDQNGKWVITPKYKEAVSFSDGLASVCTEPNKCAMINTDGVVIAGHSGESFHNGLAMRHLYTRTIGPSPNFRNIYGYMNTAGKYVWVAPGGELFLDEKWWRENYIGPHMPTSFRRP